MKNLYSAPSFKIIQHISNQMNSMSCHGVYGKIRQPRVIKSLIKPKFSYVPSFQNQVILQDLLESIVTPPTKVKRYHTFEHHETQTRESGRKVSYDLTLRHVELYRKVNDKGLLLFCDSQQYVYSPLLSGT